MEPGPGDEMLGQGRNCNAVHGQADYCCTFIRKIAVGTYSLDSSVSTGIVLSAGGAYQSPFTVTSQGTIVAPLTDGIYSAGADATLLNEGSILGNVGIKLTAGGEVTNFAGGVVTGTPYGIYIKGAAGEVYNTGAISGVLGVALLAGGAVSNAVGGYIRGDNGREGVYIEGGPGTVYNAGSIVAQYGTASPIFTEGVKLRGGGTVVNAAHAVIIGEGVGVDVSGGAGSIYNAGIIAAQSRDALLLDGGGDVINITGAVISGITTGIVADAAVSVSNAGSITGRAAVELFDGGTVSNSAGGYISGALAGVFGVSGQAFVDNAGSIFGGYGVSLRDGGTITNSAGGVISGTTYGVVIDSGTGSIDNSCSITGQSAYGVALWNSSNIVTNNASGVIYDANTGILIDGGSAAVENAGSITGHAEIGVEMFYASGTIKNLAGGVVSAGNTGIFAYGGTAAVYNAGRIYGVDAAVEFESGGIVSNAATGVITGKYAGVYMYNGTIINAGTISGGRSGYAVGFRGVGANLLEVEVGAVFTGRVAGSDGADNTLELGSSGSAGMLDMAGSFSGFQTIQFDSGAAWRLGGKTTALAGGQIIAGFTEGDTLVLDGFTATGETFTNDVGLVLSYAHSGKTAYVTLDIQGSFTTSEFHFTELGSNTDITVDVACFLAGTRIRTTLGEVAVEALTTAHLVLTPKGPLPIRWIGQSHVAPRFGDPLKTYPIRIKTGALSNGQPAHDLLVSPDHAMFLDGILIQAGALVNGGSIIRETNVPEHITYYHVELTAHSLLFAEGALAESFVDNSDRMQFQNWSTHPALGDPMEEMAYPRAKCARQVPRNIHQLLLARAAVLCGAEAA
jgi:Hint domain